MTSPIKFNAVYYAYQEGAEDISPIAINPTFSHPLFGEYLAWWEGSNHTRGTSVRVKKITPNKFVPNSPPNKITIITKDNQTIHLSRMTLEIFNKTIRSHVSQGDTLNFHSDKELEEFYLK